MHVCTGFHHSRKSRPISNQATEQMVPVILPIKEHRDFLHGRSPHFITLIISSFTSSVGFPAERSLLRKARSASRNSRTSSGDNSTIRFSALRRNIHLQHLDSFLPPLYPQMRIMANVRMKIFRKANTAAFQQAAVDQQTGIYE